MKEVVKNKFKIIAIAAIAVLVVMAGIGFWYWRNRSSAPVSGETAPEFITQKLLDQKTIDVSLGNQILLKTQNIINDKFPETNPLKQIIKNPF